MSVAFMDAETAAKLDRLESARLGLVASGDLDAWQRATMNPADDVAAVNAAAMKYANAGFTVGTHGDLALAALEHGDAFNFIAQLIAGEQVRIIEASEREAAQQ